MSDLQLVVGKPEDVNDGATYSRFVIPFAYRLRPKDKSHEGRSSADLTEYPFCYEVHSNQATHKRSESPGTKSVFHERNRERSLRQSEMVFGWGRPNGFPKGA